MKIAEIAPLLITPTQLAQANGLSESVIKKYIASGKLPAIKVGNKQWLLSKKEVAELGYKTE